MALNRQLSVFVSSTSEDLHSYRQVAQQVILARGWFPIMNEYWGAMSNPVVEACCKKMEKADLVLLLMAFRQGYVPTVDQGGNGADSITALEIEYARRNNIPVLGLLANKNTWPGDLYEDSQTAREWVKQFRGNLNLPAEFFDPEQPNPAAKETDQLPQFRSKVGAVLLNFQQELIAREEAKAAAAAEGPDFFSRACAGVVEGTIIPFMGSGVYGNGGLSARELSKALGVDACQDESCLATAAEYMERHLDSRFDFLGKLHRIIEERMAELKTPPLIYQLLLEAARPPLIVSSTCDLVLEQYLEKQGKEYTLVCHIVRSFRNENDGKLLVFDGEKHEITVADKVRLDPNKYIIYKPLGSPLLHDRLDPDLEIDTVVMTESDHLVLLGRLEHEMTQIPTALCRHLQRRPLLFAGYGLDVWHYRLVMQVFQLVQAQGSRPTPIVVRQPASSMEEMVWHRLGADILRVSPDEFAQRVLANLSPGKNGASRAG
ncbi:MAG: DUF4062 domain-containing protein [Silvibacterium sp.]|nr:DUF4062 domain-containing protein [Silvibacterium sp.]